MRIRTQRVCFLVVPGAGLFNLVGPWEVLGHTNDVLGAPAYELGVFGPDAPTSQSGHGLTLSGVRPLPRLGRRPPDTVVVAGGSPRHPLPPGCVPIVAWLRRYRRRIPRLVSVCVGAFLLGEAGILDGRRATTHWLHVKELAERFPAARVVDEGIYVEDKHVWTSAGVTAGVDLALALVERDHGHAVAMAVAKRMVLFLRRSGHQAQFSSSLRRQEQAPPELQDLAAYVLEHLDEPLQVQRLAAGIGMSPRTLHRACREHFDESPAELVRRLRLDEARRLLEESTLPLKDVTARSGLGDPTTLWRAFTERFGVSPAEYRQRFAPRHGLSAAFDRPSRALGTL